MIRFRKLSTQSLQFTKSPGAAPYILGVFGLTPFIGSTIGMFYFPSSIDQLLYLESVYGCSILSFLGAVHWGLAMTDISGKRFMFSVLPSLVGFSSCLLPHLPVTLMIQSTAFLGLYAYERKLYKAQKIPIWYLRLRLGLTTGVVTSLASSSQRKMLLKSCVSMSMSLVLAVNASIVKRQDININQPEKWFNNKMFLIVAGVTCIVLLAIFGPLIAMYIYNRRKAQQDDDIEEINTVFKSVNADGKQRRNPRDSSIMMDENRMSMASGFSFTFPSSPLYEDGGFQRKNEPTYSTIFRDSFINGSLNEPSVNLNESSVPPPYDKIKLNQTYIIGSAYSATEFDEMSVNPGDRIVVFKVYEDGWVLCMNHENKNQGVIPSDCFDF